MANKNTTSKQTTDDDEENSSIAITSRASFDTILKNAKQSNLSFLQNDDDDDDVVDFTKNYYRGFVLCIHAMHGLMMLHCTRKKTKPPHYQLPGGHVDAFEFQQQQIGKAQKQTTQLYLAARLGCGR